MSADELCELKEQKPIMLTETLTAKERESLEEKEETLGGGEKDQKEKEVVEEKELQGQGRGGGGGKDDDGEIEELRAQVFQLLLELDETREVSQRHEESFLELQGQYFRGQGEVLSVIQLPVSSSPSPSIIVCLKLLYRRVIQKTCLILGLLDDERLASAHQAESFTRQIQRLQGKHARKRFHVLRHSARRASWTFSPAHM